MQKNYGAFLLELTEKIEQHHTHMQRATVAANRLVTLVKQYHMLALKHNAEMPDGFLEATQPLLEDELRALGNIGEGLGDVGADNKELLGLIQAYLTQNSKETNA